MKRRLLAVMGILAMLLGLLPGSVFTAAPASAQGVGPTPVPNPTVNDAVVNDSPVAEPVPNVYLPIVVKSWQPGDQPPGSPPASPYADALSQALADCEDMALNQVCYAGGSVTLDGGGPLTTAGQVASLEGISGLTLVSPDADHWSVALLQLAADSFTPDLGLTLLAFGNVEIRNLILFDDAAGNGDVAPALSFSSSPVPGEDPMTGGIIVYNPTDEEPLSMRLNEADLTLASSAVVQAQPGDKMTVTEATGSDLIQTADGDGALIQAHKLTVPLDGDGKAAGAPTTPTLIADNELAAIAARDKDSRLARIVVPEFPSTYDSITANINSFADAHERCLAGNSRQVYRIMYYGRILQGYNLLYPRILTDDRMVGLDKMLQQCATFEIEFNSVITTTMAVAPGNMYIQGQGMIVSYDINGSLVQPAEMPLTHQYYNVDFALAPCLTLEIINGILSHSDGYMRINRNRLDISTTVMPVGIWENTTYICADKPLPMANPALWLTLFRKLHESETILTGYKFTPDHWKYTGNHILAEAIFYRQVPEPPNGATTGDTWLVMRHKPAADDEGQGQWDYPWPFRLQATSPLPAGRLRLTGDWINHETCALAAGDAGECPSHSLAWRTPAQVRAGIHGRQRLQRHSSPSRSCLLPAGLSEPSIAPWRSTQPRAW